MAHFLFYFHPQNLALHHHLVSLFGATILLCLIIFSFFKAKNKKTLLINFIVFFSLTIPIILYLELKAFKIDHKITPVSATTSHFFEEDEKLGLRPNSGIWKEEASDNNQNFYSVQYTIDAQGFRILSSKKGSVPYLFYGCSNTFGQGVSDTETFSSLIEMTHKNIQSVNLAMIGSSTTHMLRLIQEKNEIPYIKSPPTNAFYLFLPGHIARNTFSLSWQYSIPWYEVTSSGQLSSPSHKTLDQDLTLSRFLEHWTSFLLERLAPHKIQYSLEQLSLFEKLVLEGKRELQKRYPKIKFSIVLLQHDSLSEETLTKMKKTFQNNQVSFIDFENLNPECFQQTFLCKFKDGHLNQLGHQKLAKTLEPFL